MLINHPLFGMCITLITLCILFTDDVRVIEYNSVVDMGFGWFYVVAFAAFMIELVLTGVHKYSYCGSFFFYLDLIATMSTTIDIVDIFYGLDNLIALLSGKPNTGNVDLSSAKASRASRLGRTTRIIRIIRLTRLIRIIKLYKEAMKMQSEEVVPVVDNEDDDTLVALDCDWMNETEFNVFDEEDTKESMVSKILTDATTKKVIIYILLILVVLPLFDITLIADVNAQAPGFFTIASVLYDPAAQSNYTAAQLSSIINDNLSDYTSDVGSNYYYDIVYVKYYIEDLVDFEYMNADYAYYNFNFTGEKSLLNYWRRSEYSSNPVTFSSSPNTCTDSEGVTQVYPSQTADFTQVAYDPDSQYTCYLYSDCVLYECKFISYLALREGERISSMFSISKTLLVCVLLVLCNMFFTKDAKIQVLEPIDVMIEKVRKIVFNPMEVVIAYELEILRQMEVNEDLMAQNKLEEHIFNKNYEIEFLENKIFRIGRLLTFAYGYEGSEVIAKFAQDQSLDLIKRGEKVIGIFAMCEIVHFGELVKALDEEVIIFTNTLSYIIHKRVDTMQGIVCKNLGDTYFFMWKIPNNEILVDQETHSMKLINSFQVNNYVDMSLVCLLKVYSDINKAQEIEEYNLSEKLNSFFKHYKRNKKYKFKLDLKFGIHLGWAIESVIGSVYKMDALYLSPHVSMTKQMLDAAFFYNTRIVLSEDFFNYLSIEVKKEVRPVDIVSFNFNEAGPTKLYTCDCFVDDVKTTDCALKKTYREKLSTKRENWQLKQEMLTLMQDDDYKVSDMFNYDSDLMVLRNSMCQLFYEKYDEGFTKYIRGTWKEAKEAFDQCEDILKYPDGPSKTLLNFMSKYQFDPMDAWEGYKHVDGFPRTI